MSGIRSVNRATDSQSISQENALTLPSWKLIPGCAGEVRAISPLVDRLMRLIEGSLCVPGEEFDVELALREALNNAVVLGNREDPETKVHIRCRCQPGNELSIVVTDQGKGFDFEKTVGNGIATDPDSEHGRGIPLMKAFMDDVHFERGGSEVHMRKGSRTNFPFVRAGTGKAFEIEAVKRGG
jgi:serine/threonine-protein kinase RsbW